MTQTLAPQPDRPPQETEPAADVRFGVVAAVVFGVLLLPRILAHEMWRDEWQAWMLSVPTPGLGELFERLSYEGHPGLWHLLLWTGGAIWPDPLLMKLLHAMIASAAAGVIGAAMPMPRWQRALLLAGYFVSFEYAVISRGYGLGLLGLAGFAAFWTLRPRAYIAQGLCLALAAQANFLATLLAISLGLVTVIRAFLERSTLSSRELLRLGIGAAILAGGLALTAWQVWPRPDRAYAQPASGLEVARAGHVAANAWRSFVPLPSPQRAWWSSNLLDFTLSRGVMKAVQPLLGCLVLAGFTMLIWPDRWGRLLWLLGAAMLLGFGYFVFPGTVRHAGHLWVLAILCVWLARGVQPGWRRGAWLGLLAIHALTGVIAAVADVALPFSAARATAELLNERYPEAVVIGQRDFDASAVAGELGRRIYYPSPGRFGSYVIWDNRRSTFIDPARLVEDATRLAGEGRPVILLISDGSIYMVRPEDTAAQGGPFREVAHLQDSTVPSERYRVYEFLPSVR